MPPRNHAVQQERPPLTAEALSRHILALLPQDGSALLNRILHVKLSNKLHTGIDRDLFLEARDILLNKGAVGRLPGQGGKLFLSAKPVIETVNPPAHRDGEPWTEAQLMTPLGAYLTNGFRDESKKTGEWFVRDTSRMGGIGRWARPDFIAVAATRFNFMPGVQVDVHSFELKTETGVDTLAVHEALAQTRFTHFGHLVWHLPVNSNEEEHLAEVEEQCSAHGLGLIRICNPLKPEETQILLDPVRKPTAAAIIDEFLLPRLSGEQQERLATFVHGKAP